MDGSYWGVSIHTPRSVRREATTRSVSPGRATIGVPPVLRFTFSFSSPLELSSKQHSNDLREPTPPTHTLPPTPSLSRRSREPAPASDFRPPPRTHIRGRLPTCVTPSSVFSIPIHIYTATYQTTLFRIHMGYIAIYLPPLITM